MSVGHDVSDNTTGQNGTSSNPGTPHSVKTGWDGKLRVGKQATLANPEALSDPEYSDEDAPPVDQIDADEDLLEGEDPDTEACLGNTSALFPKRMLTEIWEKQEIDCQHSRISSMSRLRLDRFKALRKLCLRQNLIQSIELPSTCTSTLEDLELYDNLIKHVEGLEEFTELRSLDLSYNKLKHIKNLSTLKKLDHLYFVQNRISHIENLAELTELLYLELGANKIREIDGLDTLTKLQHLWLGSNRITELKGLSNLHQLRTLSIQANRLTSLDGIEALPTLTELYISDNKIPSLAPLRPLTRLEILDFQSNPVSSLEGLEPLLALENVWASNCRVDSFSEIERALADKPALEEVYFEGCPVQTANPVLYRKKLLLALPRIVKIDASYVKST